MTFSH